MFEHQPDHEQVADFIQCLIDGDVAKLRSYVQAKAKVVHTFLPKARDHGTAAWLPIHYAADAGQSDVVVVLLEAGAQPDSRTRFPDPAFERATALHLAAAHGHERVTRLLLDHHATANVTDSQGLTPADIARAGGHQHLAEVLEDA